MKDLLNQLYRTKMILTSLILGVAGILLIVVDRAIADDDRTWAELIPWSELGGILIGAGLLGIWIDHLFKAEQAGLDEARLQRLLKDHAPAMRDAVVQGFAADQADMARVATPNTLDLIITNALGLRLEDNEFASEIYADLQQQAINIEERWYDASVFINVTPHERDGYFDVTTRWEYTTVPKHPVRRFGCFGDRQEFAELAQKHDELSAWYFAPDDSFSASDKEVFEVLHFAVDGKARAVKRSSRKAYQEYSVAIGSQVIEAGQPVTISYTTITITAASRHLLFFDIEQPTDGIDISFDYTGTDIESVSAVDLVQTMRPSRTEHTPKEVTPKTMRVEIDGWVFPRSGVAFVWRHEQE